MYGRLSLLLSTTTCSSPPPTRSCWAASPKCGGGERVCDLGAGIGLPGLMLLSREPELHITNIDIDSAACALAGEAPRPMAWDRRICVVQADLRDRTAAANGGSFDLCVANPPYFPPHTGRVAEGSRGVQRAELQCTMDELCAAAAYLLRSGGRLYLIHRAGAPPS